MGTHRLKCAEYWNPPYSSWHARITTEITNPIFEVVSHAMISKLPFDKPGKVAFDWEKWGVNQKPEIRNQISSLMGQKTRGFAASMCTCYGQLD